MIKLRFLVGELLLGVFIWGCNNTGQTSKHMAGGNSGYKYEHIEEERATSPDSLPLTTGRDRSMSVTVLESDTFHIESDTQYGVGDDDLFTANDFSIYRLKEGQYIDETKTLNDYDLTTSFKNVLEAKHPDTFLMVISFPGLVAAGSDTLVVINSIDIFNGNRKSLIDWNSSGAIKKMSAYINSRLLGEITLENTYKLQAINLFNQSLYHLRGASDTIKLIVQDIYPNPAADHNTYFVSEIKLGGIRLY